LHENRNYISTLLVEEEKRWEKESKKKKSKSKDKKEKSKERRKKKRDKESSDSEKSSEAPEIPDVPSRLSMQLPPSSARSASGNLKQVSSNSLRHHTSSSSIPDVLYSARNNKNDKTNAALSIVALTDVLLHLALFPPNREEKEEKEKERSFLPTQLNQLNPLQLRKA